MAALLVVCAALGWWAYTVDRDTSALGTEVYRELDGDGLPVPEGTLDDPVFSGLPVPTDRPISLGRYKPLETASDSLPPPAPVDKRKSVGTQSPANDLPRSNSTQSSSRKARIVSTQAPQSILVTPGNVLASQNAPRTAQPTVPKKPMETAHVESAPVTVPAPMITPAAAAAPTLAPTDFTQRLKTDARIHILLIATDQETLGGGRGDVLLVLTLNPLGQTLTLLSIPRDTRVGFPGEGLVKINAAYALGGATAQTQAVERFLGIPMDKYVEISLGGFREAIDLAGGVDVNPKFSFQLDGSVFKPGPVHLNGEQALAYSRMRKEDPLGDLGRNVRQQEVVRQLMGTLGRRSAADLQHLLNQLSSHLRTNFSPSEVVRLRAVHSYMLDSQQTAHVQGVNRKISGIWFYMVSDAERRRLHILLQ